LAIRSANSSQASTQARLQRDIAAGFNTNSTNFSKLQLQLEDFARSYQTSQAQGTSILSQKLSYEILNGVNAFKHALESSLGPTENQLKELSRKLDQQALPLTRYPINRQSSPEILQSRVLPDSAVHEIPATDVRCALKPTKLEDIDWTYARAIAAVMLFAASKRIISTLKVLQQLFQNLVCICPQLVLFMRTFHFLARSPPHLLSDNIHFEDVLGRLHSLPFPYFQHREVFLEALRCSFLGFPGVERIANGKFKILDHRMRSLTACNWKDYVVPGAKLIMSVEVDYLQLGEQGCPSRDCNGQLRAGKSSTSVCTICEKIYLIRDDIRSDQPTTPSMTENAALACTTLALSEMLYQKHLDLPDTLVLKASHDYFHEFRRAVGKDFISFCSQMITGIEELRDELFEDTESERSIPVKEDFNGENRDDVDAVICDAMIRLPTDAEKESSWKIIAQGPSLRLDWPSARVSNAKDYADYARRRELLDQASEARHRQQTSGLEREEIHAYRRVQIGVTPHSINLSEAIISGDIPRVAQALPANPRINELNNNGFSPLTLAVISGNAVLVDLLLESGANPLVTSCVQDQCDNALYAATISGNISILLSLLSALDCFSAHLLDTSPHWKQRTTIIDRTFRAAVRENQQLAVALLLYFGFQPFHTSNANEESIYEAALRQERYDIVASFLVLARERDMLNLQDTRKVLSAIIENNGYSLEGSFNELFVQTRRVLTAKAQTSTNSGSLIDFLANSTSSLQAFAQQAPIVVVGCMKNRNEKLLDVEFGLVEALEGIRNYFMNHLTKSLPMIHHVIRLLDRSLSAVHQVRGKRSATQSITDFLLTEIFSSDLNDLIETLQSHISTVNSNFGKPDKLVLDDVAYWRLQKCGFVEICAVLTDLKNLMRDLYEDLAPFKIDLNKIAREHAPDKYAYCFERTRRLSPSNPMYVGVTLVYAPTSATDAKRGKTRPRLIRIADPEIAFGSSEESAELDLQAAQDVFHDMRKRASVLRALSRRR
jgi:ankyrin repeat protein